MQDINNPLLTAYYDIISAIHPETWTDEEPDDVNHNLYVVISDVTNSDASTKNSQNLNTSIQVAIHSWENKYNSSLEANTLAGLIMDAINPKPQSTLSIAGSQIVTTKLTSDTTNRLGDINGRKYISRFLTFSHYIYQ